MLRLELARAIDDGRDRLGDAEAAFAHLLGRRPGGPHHHFLRALAFVYELTSHEEEQSGTGGVDVAARRQLARPAPGLLGRHVRGRPEHGPRARHGRGRAVHGSRHAEVEDLEMALFREEQIFWLDVAVYDAGVVGGGEAIHEFDGELHGLDGRHRPPALDPLPRGLPFE